MPAEYDFTVDWFSPRWPVWLAITAGAAPRRILEVGSYEGRSATLMIEEFGGRGPLHLFCIDTWAGSVEHGGTDMAAVEARFDRNVALAASRAANTVVMEKCKGPSAERLARLLAGGHEGSFDLVFIDGSHQAPDVLTDLVLGYRLCRIGGFLFCDDYLWSMEPDGRQDPLNMPKPAIDAFANLFMRRIKQFEQTNYQAYFRRTA